MKLQLLLLAVASLLVASVGLLATSEWIRGDGSDEDGDRAVLRPVDGRYLPVVMSSDLAVGPSRLVLGLIEQETGSEVLNADVTVRLFEGARASGEPIVQTEAVPMSVTRAITVDGRAGDRTLVESGEAAAYIANVTFKSDGLWTADINGEVDGEVFGPVPVVFSVRDRSQSVAIGDLAPRTAQLTLDDVDDVSEIDTSAVPDPEWHKLTVAEALDLGKPVVVAFATPGFCTSQLCAPLTEALAAVYPAYREKVTFVHIEPYDLTATRAGKGLDPVPAMDEWGLTNEPWIFIVDARGRVAAKFEGFASSLDLEAALGAMVNENADG